MVNLIVGWKEFGYLKNLLSFSIPSVQMRNISSRYLNYRKGLNLLFPKTFFSRPARNKLVYSGGSYVAIAVPGGIFCHSV